MDYIILDYGSSDKEFAKKCLKIYVEEKLREGYELQGGISLEISKVISKSGSRDWYVYSQAMIKK